jgi:leader peptidase (prepilin peptidase)/N-methyltransferase
VLIPPGLLAGWLAHRFSGRLSRRIQQEGLAPFTRPFPPWLLPGITAVLLVMTWNQAPYRAGPFYLFAANGLLLWLLLLVAATDFLTHLIFPAPLIALAVLSGLELLVTALFKLPVGVVLTGSGEWQPVQSPDRRTAAPGFVQLWPLNPADSLLGALALGGLFWLLYGLGRVLYRQEALGAGDVLLAGVIGLALGFRRAMAALPVVMVLSFLVALLFLLLARAGKTKPVAQYLAFGPFLCGGAIWTLVLV